MRSVQLGIASGRCEFEREKGGKREGAGWQSGDEDGEPAEEGERVREGVESGSSEQRTADERVQNGPGQRTPPASVYGEGVGVQRPGGRPLGLRVSRVALQPDQPPQDEKRLRRKKQLQVHPRYGRQRLAPQSRPPLHSQHHTPAPTHTSFPPTPSLQYPSLLQPAARIQPRPSRQLSQTPYRPPSAQYHSPAQIHCSYPYSLWPPHYLLYLPYRHQYQQQQNHTTIITLSLPSHHHRMACIAPPLLAQNQSRSIYILFYSSPHHHTHCR